MTVNGELYDSALLDDDLTLYFLCQHFSVKTKAVEHQVETSFNFLMFAALFSAPCVELLCEINSTN